MPIARFVTTSSISNYTNCRNQFFQVGTGGTTPYPTHKYPWSPLRAAAPVTSSGIPVYGDTAGSPFQMNDAYGVANDSAFDNFKDFHDALLTIIAEMRGVSIWYTSSAFSSYIAGLNLNQIMFDSPGGHHMEPMNDTWITWARYGDAASPARKLRTEGTGPMKFRANYGNVAWEVGGTYTSANQRTFSSNLFDVVVPPGSNLYLGLVREVAIASGAAVNWLPATGANLNPARSIKGNIGDFTGIAVGDWVRKDSEGASRYYQVAKLWSTALASAVVTDGAIADGALAGLVDEIETERDIDAHSVEAMKYFRQRYDASALIADNAAARAAGTYNDTAYFWLGWNTGNSTEQFCFREYGAMEEGESRYCGDDSEGARNRDMPGLKLEIYGDTRYVSNNLGYMSAAGVFTTAAGTDLLALYKRTNLRNTININETVWTFQTNLGALSADGTSIWARLTSVDGAAHVLTHGNILTDNDSDQILLAGNTPPDSFVNQNVYCLCTRRTIGGIAYLKFFDGTLLGPQGLTTEADAMNLGRVVNDAGEAHKCKTTAASPYTIDYRNDFVVEVTALTGVVKSVVLPAMANADLVEGSSYVVKDGDGTALSAVSGCIQVTASDGALIDGVAYFDIDAPWMSVEFYRIGSVWRIR